MSGLKTFTSNHGANGYDRQNTLGAFRQQNASTISIEQELVSRLPSEISDKSRKEATPSGSSHQLSTLGLRNSSHPQSSIAKRFISGTPGRPSSPSATAAPRWERLVVVKLSSCHHLPHTHTFPNLSLSLVTVNPWPRIPSSVRLLSLPPCLYALLGQFRRSCPAL